VHQARVRARFVCHFVPHFVEKWAELDKVMDEVKDKVTERDAPPTVEAGRRTVLAEASAMDENTRNE
jgi:hypothetical protein